MGNAPSRNSPIPYTIGLRASLPPPDHPTMLSEEFYSCICGPPIAANTAVSKDVGIYAHSLSPSYSVKSTLKKSNTPANCLAVSDAHVFAAQHEKSQVHVYSRARGIQEAVVTFPEKIRSLALIDDILALGTAEGRLILWEVSKQIQSLFRREETKLRCVVCG